MPKQKFAKGLIVIYRQQILDCLDVFTKQPVKHFYDILFQNLDLSGIPAFPAKGRKGFSAHAMLRAFILMKIERFHWITQLIEYLDNNLIIAYFCGFDPAKKLPSYSAFDRFIQSFPHELLDHLMASQVQDLYKKGILSSAFIGIDSMPIFANTKLNNPNAFHFDKNGTLKQPKSDLDCRLGAHASSNAPGKNKVYYYQGYKEHVAVDCISGLPLACLTTPANVADCSVALNLVKKTNTVIPLYGGALLADKGYDAKYIYDSLVQDFALTPYIPLNMRNTKKKLFSGGRLLCKAGLPMNKGGKSHDNNRTRQRFYCPLRLSKDKDCPCKHEKFYNGKVRRGCEQWVTVPDDLRLQIDRHSYDFKITYARRTWCERYNSRFKMAGNARMWVRSLSAVSNMNVLTHIAILSVALAAVNTGNAKGVTSIKAMKCSA